MVHSVPFPAVFRALSSIFLTCCPTANVVQMKRTVPRNPTSAKGAARTAEPSQELLAPHSVLREFHRRSNLIRCDVMFSTAYTQWPYNGVASNTVYSSRRAE